MKKSIFYGILVFIAFLVLLYPEKPFREYLIETGWDYAEAKLSAGLVVRLILVFLSFKAMQYFNTLSFSGFLQPLRGRNFQALLLALVFIGFGLYSNVDTYLAAPTYLLILFLCFVVAVGVLEELVFRGLIFPILARHFSNTSHPFILAPLFSGLLFGMVHFVNLFQQPDNWQGITSQVFFALSIGVYFSGLMLRTENIWWPILIHALVNFSFGAGMLDGSSAELLPDAGEKEWTWSKIIPTTFFFAFILSGGLFMIMKADARGMFKLLSKH
jgi:membrane protease YdiL (CAAX protease family)